jgi:hypothetical protein
MGPVVRAAALGSLLGAGPGQGCPVGFLVPRPCQGHVETASVLHLCFVHGLGFAGCPAARLFLLGARSVPVQPPASGQLGTLGFARQLGFRRDPRGLAAAVLLVQLGLAVVQVRRGGGGGHDAGPLGYGRRDVVPPRDVVGLGNGVPAAAVAVGVASVVDQAPQPPCGQAAHVVHPGHAAGQQLDQLVLGGTAQGDLDRALQIDPGGSGLPASKLIPVP